MINLKKEQFNEIKYKLDIALNSVKQVQSFLKSYDEDQRAFKFKQGWRELNNKPIAKTIKQWNKQRAGHSG